METPQAGCPAHIEMIQLLWHNPDFNSGDFAAIQIQNGNAELAFQLEMCPISL